MAPWWMRLWLCYLDEDLYSSNSLEKIDAKIDYLSYSNLRVLEEHDSNLEAMIGMHSFIVDDQYLFFIE